MLHRVTRSLRVLLLAAGVLLLAWLPIGFYFESCIWFHNSSADCHGLAFVRNGYLCVMLTLSEAGNTRAFPLLARPVAEPQSSLLEQAPSRSTSSESYSHLGFETRRIDFRNIRPLYKLLPSFEYSRAELDAALPLWLLVVACLGWPTTSFVVKRRRRKRGFSIDTAASTRSAVM